MFVGIGLLLTFLRRYSYSAITLTLLGGVLAVLLGIVVMGLVQQAGTKAWNGKVQLDLPLFINANFVACAAVISIGAFMGKTSPTQVPKEPPASLTCVGCEEPAATGARTGLQTGNAGLPADGG